MNTVKTIVFITLTFICTQYAITASQVSTHCMKIDKHDVYYNTAGEKGDDNAILFLHGLFADKEQWWYLMEYFSNKGYYTVAPDLPGYGKSNDFPLSVYAIEKQVVLIKEFIDEIGLKNINLAGNSLGCAVAIAFTNKYKGDIKTVALLGGPAGLGTWTPEIMKIYETGSNPFIPLTVKEFNEEMKLLFYQPPSIPKERINKIIAGYKRNLNKNISIFNIFNLSLYNFLYNLNINFNKPTLIVWGKEDKVMNVIDAKNAQKKIQGSQLVILENAGHLIMVENAKKVVEIYRKFLAENID